MEREAAAGESGLGSGEATWRIQGCYLMGELIEFRHENEHDRQTYIVGHEWFCVMCAA